MNLRVSFIFLFLLTACRDDESVRAYGAADKKWRLIELAEKPFDASATLTFPETGRISGTAPCNTYSGAMTVPYPWFEVGPIAATKRACPDLASEAAFFSALKAVPLSEVLDDTLILSNTDGLKMVFTAGG